MINIKQQIVIGSLKDAFERKKHEKWISVLCRGNDIYFHDYKLAIEVDGLGQKIKVLISELKYKKQ